MEDLDESRHRSSILRLKRHDQRPITTGSVVFDSLFGGGLPIASVTDIYGAAATGKTQFAFQNAVMTCSAIQTNEGKPSTIFVDCAGSFRPERIAEIAELRGINSTKVLDSISSVSVRSVSEQIVSTARIAQDELFSKCRLIIVDDVTANFTSEMNSPEQIIERQSLLSSYVRKLAHIANASGVSVLLTNSVRSRGDSGVGEATGDIIAQYSLFRLFFQRTDRTRSATIEQPLASRTGATFEIESRGIP